MYTDYLIGLYNMGIPRSAGPAGKEYHCSSFYAFSFALSMQ